jgi:DNA-binding MarR family transcriptional regulator
MYDLTFADETLTTWALLRQTWLIANRAAETRLSKVGLTPEHVAVMWICRDYRGITSTAEIARIVSRRSQSITSLLTRMETEGLITKTPRRKGRPFTEVRLTETGREACQVGITVVKTLISESKSVLSADERRTLHTLLRRMRQHLVDSMRMELTAPPDMPVAEAIPVKW